jgi:hypothetical protein
MKKIDKILTKNDQCVVFFLTFMKDVLGQNIAKVTTNTSNFQRDLLGKHLTVSCRKKLFIAKKE